MSWTQPHLFTACIKRIHSSFFKMVIFCTTHAAVPLHGICGSNAVVSSNSVQVSVHHRQTHSAAGAAQGCYICTPAVCVWAVPAMMEVKERGCQSVKVKSDAGNDNLSRTNTDTRLHRDICFFVCLQSCAFKEHRHAFTLRESFWVAWASVQTSVRLFPLHWKAIKIVFSPFKAIRLKTHIPQNDTSF